MIIIFMIMMIIIIIIILSINLEINIVRNMDKIQQDYGANIPSANFT